MKNKLLIYTGKIQTGKTTSLFTLVNKVDSVDGILAPVVNGKRCLYHISSKTIKELEVDKSNADSISIGKFIFLKKSFDWANQKIIEAVDIKPNLLIIDEIGKLELIGEGLDKSARFAIENISCSDSSIILVVRDYLVDDVIKYYTISSDNYEISTDIHKILDLTSRNS